MAAEIKAGDCVELKYGGGGVQMTVEEVEEYSEGIKAKCTYYNSSTKKFETQFISPGSLKLCEEK